jgi:hypothetical protein
LTTTETPARVLAGLDCSFVVRRPAELRDALELWAEKIATLAKRTGREASPEKAPNSRVGENSPPDWRAEENPYCRQFREPDTRAYP